MKNKVSSLKIPEVIVERLCNMFLITKKSTAVSIGLVCALVNSSNAERLDDFALHQITNIVQRKEEIRLKETKIYNMDILELIEKNKNAQNTIFIVDPPYLNTNVYKNDILTLQNKEFGYKEHVKLAKLLRQITKEGENNDFIYFCRITATLFQSDNPDFEYRLGYQAADQKLRKLCKRLHTTAKSPHKIRKTCISTLLDDPNVNDRTVQRFAGHSDISTTYRFYNFERKSKEEQALAIEKALAL